MRAGTCLNMAWGLDLGQGRALFEHGLGFLPAIMTSNCHDFQAVMTLDLTFTGLVAAPSTETYAFLYISQIKLHTCNYVKYIWVIDQA